MIKYLNDCREYLQNNKFSKIYLLVDENTEKYCLPILVEQVEDIVGCCLLEVKAGEDSKSIKVVEDLCRTMIEDGADRNSAIISLGGGVITDLGGFVSSIFKRGIQNINIPTTLLAMVDASVGGKTGINLDGYKNQIGTFNFSSLVFYDYKFLDTLAPLQILNGMAEMIKIALVKDELLWDKMQKNEVYDKQMIEHCINHKQQIVDDDKTEQGQRKILNFGHTIGHAIESMYLTHHQEMLHGEAVANGMFYAIKLSENKQDFPHEKAKLICDYLQKTYNIIDIKPHLNEIYSFLVADKKNKNGHNLFVLLKDIANPIIDCPIVYDDLLNISL